MIIYLHLQINQIIFKKIKYRKIKEKVLIQYFTQWFSTNNKKKRKKNKRDYVKQ